MLAVSLTQPLVGMTDRIEERLPKQLSPRLALSVLASYRYVGGSAYEERRYLTLDYAVGHPTPTGFVVFEGGISVLRLPGKRLAELPCRDSEEWERVGEEEDE